MTKQKTYLLIGGAGLAGLGLWWWWSQQQATAAAQITAQPSVPATALPPVLGPVKTLVSEGNPSIPPVGTSTTPSGVDVTELNALLAWSNGTQNPALYAQMINQLTPAQVDSLYNILTTDWDVAGGQPTAAQTAFWNGLVAQYPFLKTGGQGCTTLACN
jgi:hypothetical protein